MTRDEADFGAWLNWMHHGEATLTFPQTLVLRYRHMEPEERRLPQAADDYQRWFLARLRAIDAVLAGTAFLCAGRFTVRDYWGRLKQRDAYRRALQVQAQAAEAQGVSPVPAPLAGR